MSNLIKVGDLVVTSTPERRRVGLVLTQPSIFGFLDRSLVLWSDEKEEWCFVDNLRLVDKDEIEINKEMS